MPYLIYQNSPPTATIQAMYLVQNAGIEATNEKEAVEVYLKKRYPANTDKRNTLRPHLVAQEVDPKAIKLISCITVLKNRLIAKRIMKSVYQNTF